MSDVSVEWLGHGRKATQPPNPAYPEGLVIRNSAAVAECQVVLPEYPAPECGAWLLNCKKCGASMGVTAAGRPDDPREVWLPCNKTECDHSHYRFARHGRRCTCGEWMVDFGD